MGTTVETASGRIQGQRCGGHERFLGVPFAEPPTGSLRFLAPRAVSPWTGVRSATAYAPAAAQTTSGLPGMSVERQSEDCLALNVFTPSPDASRRPVMVWIHGGAYLNGSASQRLYDGGALCERGDVVVVTIQYRLGVLGYLPVAGGDRNLGALDQVLALRWVRENIAHFGGDPDAVTLFGESAGGNAVSTLMAMPAARGLFRRVIAQSGAARSSAQLAFSEEHVAQLERAFRGELGLEGATLGQLQAVPLEPILDAQQRAILALRGEGRHLPLGPLIDPDSLPVAPLDAIERGDARGLPLLAGTNRDEAKLFRMAEPGSVDAQGLRSRVRAGLRVSACDEAAADALIAAYADAHKARGHVSPDELYDAIDSDRMFRVPMIRMVEAQSAHCPYTFVYLFEWRSPVERLGACHALELPFVFGTLDAPTMDRFAGRGPAAEALSASMMNAWIAFAHTGDPSAAGTPGWAAYERASRPTWSFGGTSSLVSDPLGRERAAWDGLL